MSKELESGWWYCNCEIPCNCGDKEKPKKLRPPEVKACMKCNTFKRKENN